MGKYIVEAQVLVCVSWPRGTVDCGSIELARSMGLPLEPARSMASSMGSKMMVGCIEAGGGTNELT